MKYSRKTIIILSAVIVLIIIGALLANRSYHHKSQKAEVPAEPTPEVVAQAPHSVKTTYQNSTATSVPAEKREAYQSALVTYKDRLVQLDNDCSAFPRQSGFKAGTSIMIDNRAGTPRLIHVLDKRIVIASYDYYIMNFASPGTYMLDCGTLKNVATITIQS